MDLLESKIKLLILNFLDLKYLLKCRLINREFNKLITSNLKIEQLSIFHAKDKTKNSGRFFQTDHLINDAFSLDHLIDLEQFEANRLMFNNLGSLKRLFLSNCHLKFRTNLVSFLNKLEKLANLEQVQLKLKPDRNLNNLDKCVLELSRINILSIEIDPSIKTPFILSINCASLHSFRTNKSLANFNFLKPSKIKAIDLINLDGYLKQFSSSLEVLYLKNGDSIVSNENDQILFRKDAFPSLFELHCKRFLKFQNLIKLMKQKRKFGSKIDFYLYGFKIGQEIDCRNMFSDEHLGNGCFEILLSENYENLIKTGWESTVQYDELVKQFNNSLPDDLFKSKLINLRKLSINGSNESIKLDKSQIFKLLSECKVLNFLDLRHLFLDQSFYDNLIKVCLYLQYLSIIFDKETNIDYKFILNHIYLETFSTNQTLPLDTIATLIRNLKFLRKIKFKAKNNDTLNVRKNVDVLFLDIFVCLTSNRINRTFYNLNKLINYVGRFMDCCNSEL